MNLPACALALTPLAWIEAADLESLIFEKSTWIPLAASVPEFELGKKGFAGHRESYRSLESLVVPLREREEFKDADWQTIMRHGGTDGVWADENNLYPPGCYNQTPRIIYPVILRSFDSGEPDEWVLQQEIEIGLQLLRKGDTWICPHAMRNGHGGLYRHRLGTGALCASMAGLPRDGYDPFPLFVLSHPWPRPRVFQKRIRVAMQQIGLYRAEHLPLIHANNVPFTDLDGREIDPAKPVDPTLHGTLDRQGDDWACCAWFYLNRTENGLPPLAPFSERISGLGQ